MTSKLRVTRLGAGNSPRTGEFPAQMASYAENVSVWWRDDVIMELNNYMQIIFVEVMLAVHSILKNRKTVAYAHTVTS